MYDAITARHDLFHTLPRIVQRMFDEIEPRAAGPHVPVDLVETDTEVRLLLEVPGLDRESLKVTLENGLLTVAGEKKQPQVTEDAQYRGERRFGPFERRFRVSNRVDQARIEAKYADGVLEVLMPKTADAQARRIEVK